MSSGRSWAERERIFRAIIGESNPPPLSAFGLSPGEDVFYRARAAKTVALAARRTSAFRQYYALRVGSPTKWLTIPSGFVGLGAFLSAVYLWTNAGDQPAYPIYAALLSIAAVACGWVVTGSITHRMAIRQNTYNMVFARFTHAPFNDALLRFHRAFEFDQAAQVTREKMFEMRASEKEGDFEATVAVMYILNYLEFVAIGVINGDLNRTIIRNTLRGFVCYYHDKCEPYVRHVNGQNPKALANLVKLRTHYRDP